MAFLFTHEWIAKLALQKIKKKKFISNYSNIDDYFFGAIAPDIRYVNNSLQNVTHRPVAENKKSSFAAGFETHLIVDDAWSNKTGWVDKSLYEFYGVNVNDPKQKFALYFLVDDYFQSEASWLFPLECAGYILRANEYGDLLKLGFSNNEVILYKSLAAVYLREPGIDTFNALNFVPSKLDEMLIRRVLEEKKVLTSILKEFKKVSIEKCTAYLDEHL